MMLERFLCRELFLVENRASNCGLLGKNYGKQKAVEEVSIIMLRNTGHNGSQTSITWKIQTVRQNQMKLVQI